MRVGILGPLEVTGNGGPVEIGGARLRTLLIRLALDAGRLVHGGGAGRRAVGRHPAGGPGERRCSPWFRGCAGRCRTERCASPAPAGYRLELPADAVDASRFERLAAQGRQALRAGDAGAARPALLGEALACGAGRRWPTWPTARFALAAAARLAELRLAAAEDRIEAELALRPRTPGWSPSWRTLAAAHPLRERLRGRC